MQWHLTIPSPEIVLAYLAGLCARFGLVTQLGLVLGIQPYQLFIDNTNILS